MSKRSTPVAGFTIVELLIVIVVIAIVAYNGIQARARDSPSNYRVPGSGWLDRL